jgi:hypothetical protein
MIESIVCISVFILFFLGMVYFRSMYQQKLRMTRLGRAAAVGYALSGCSGSNPLAQVSADLGNATNAGQPGAQQGTGGGISSGNPSVGSGAPLSGAESSKGTIGDPIALIKMSGPASGTTQSSAIGPKLGFSATVGTSSYMSCGQAPEAGSVSGALQFVKGLFSGSGF